jgi:putative ABC transport system substrate-binding protein
LSNISPELAPKRLELLQQMVSRLARLAVLGDPSSPSYPPQWIQTESAAQSIGVQVRSFEVREPAPDFAGAFSAISTFGADALITLTQPLIDVYRDQIVAFAAARRMPGMFHARAYVEAGGLMSYAPSIRELFRRAATYVDKILKGANPADLPVEQPTRFDFVINLKTARDFGLTIPQEVLMQATEVIE